MNKNNLKSSPAIIIMRRELGAYFTSPVAYIVTGLFLIITGVMFFTTFYLYNRAELRNMFTLMPVILSLFIPALTMRLFAEEKKSGSLETLMTLPVTEFDVVLGKFLAAFISSLTMIAPTLFYLLGILPFGTPDAGPVIGGYIGTVFLCAAADEARLSAALHGIEGIESISFDKNEDANLVTAYVAAKNGEDLRPTVAKAVISNGIDLYELAVQRNSLEDVFHTLTADSSAKAEAENGAGK